MEPERSDVSHRSPGHGPDPTTCAKLVETLPDLLLLLADTREELERTRNKLSQAGEQQDQHEEMLLRLRTQVDALRDELEASRNALTIAREERGLLGQQLETALDDGRKAVASAAAAAGEHQVALANAVDHARAQGERALRAEAEFRAVTLSFSWRITAPMRFMTGRIRRSFRLKESQNS